MRILINYISFLILSCLLGTYTLAWSQSNKTIIKEYKKAKKEAIDKFGEFDLTNRMELYQLMDQLPRIVFGKLQPKLLANKNYTINNTDYLVAFYDYDNDGLADQFVLQTLGKKIINNEFGFIYDLNKDGKMDYIIYNGGSMITNDDPFFYYFYHWIDTNFDGIVDALAYNNIIYFNDSRPDPTKIFWIMDIDKNGKPDLVDFIDIKKGNVNPINDSEGIWTYKNLFGSKTIHSEDNKYFDLYNDFLEAVNKK